MAQMTLDEILAGANKALKSANTLKVSRDADAAAMTTRRETGPSIQPQGKVRRTIDRLKDTFGNQPIVRVADAVAPAAAFASNPIGQAAGGYLAVKSLDELSRDPSMMNAGMAALGAMPFLKPVHNAVENLHWADAFRKSKAAANTGGVAKKATSFAKAKVLDPREALDPSTWDGVATSRPHPTSRGGDPVQGPNRIEEIGASLGLPSKETRVAMGTEGAGGRWSAASKRSATGVVDGLPDQVKREALKSTPPLSMQSLSSMTGGGALDDMVRQTVTEPMPGPFGGHAKEIVRGGADDVPNNPVARRVEAERRTGRELTEDEIDQLLANADTFDNGAVPSHLKALDTAHDAQMQDWRTIPPAADSKAHFVKEHVGKSQQQMAQELGERDFGWAGRAKIKRVKAPLYPSGNSKTDKLVAAMRQREKLMGFQD